MPPRAISSSNSYSPKERPAACAGEEGGASPGARVGASDRGAGTAGMPSGGGRVGTSDGGGSGGGFMAGLGCGSQPVSIGPRPAQVNGLTGGDGEAGVPFGSTPRDGRSQTPLQPALRGVQAGQQAAQVG